MELNTLLQKAAHYTPSPSALATIQHVPLLFIAGISGAGKDTILKRLVADYPDKYEFMVSYTTRKPRMNHGVMEQTGVEYHFISLAIAERMLDQGEFVETNYYAGNIYGTGIDEISRVGQSGKTVLRDIDVNGIDNYMQLGMNLKPVFLIPPSYKVWWQRLLNRYTRGATDSADMQKRLKTALEELEFALAHDYFYVVVNDDLERTVQQVHALSQQAGAQQHNPADAAALGRLTTDVRAKLASPLVA